jgi:hypothetical protein
MAGHAPGAGLPANAAEARNIGAQNDALVNRPWEIWKAQALARQQGR